MGRSNSAGQNRLSELLDRWEKNGSLSESELAELNELKGVPSGGAGAALVHMLRRDQGVTAQGDARGETSSAGASGLDRVDAIMGRVHEDVDRRRFQDGEIRVRGAAFWGRFAAAAAAVLVVIAVTAVVSVNLDRGGDSRAVASADGESGVRSVEDLDGGTEPAAERRTVVVRFELVAPEASSVALVGDFNGWDERTHSLTDRDGDGVWEVEVPLQRGEVYTYNFLLDGGEWIPDPNAVNHIEDSFGGEKSVLNL